MTNWTELGEVPDSEDESLDFSESSILQVPEERRGDSATDIWDVPNSPTSVVDAAPSQKPVSRIEQPHFDSLASSPLSSIATDIESPRLSIDFTRTQDGDQNPGSSELGDLTAFPLPPTKSTNDVQLSHKSAGADAVSSQRNSEEARSAQYLEARQAAVGFERSLRPRKPIQEHPYLLENAQYSSFLKMHGVKPIRLLSYQETRTNSSQNQDDDEFEEESQESAMRRLDEDVATMNIPSSTPPDASPAENIAPASSSQSSMGDTDNTSILEQELPALRELLDRPGRRATHATAQHASLPEHSSTRKRRGRNVIDSDPVDDDAKDAPKSKPVLKIPPPLMDIARENLDERGPVMEISSDDEGAKTDSDEKSASSPVEADGQVVSTMKKRIRGVLPASWVRLDQQAGLDKAKTSAQNRRRQHWSPEHEYRRGVAQLTRAQPGAVTASILFDESEDEESGLQTMQEPRAAVQTTLPVTMPVEPTVHEYDSSDGGSSAMEDDRVDYMLPPGRSNNKRQLTMMDAIRQNGDSKRLKLASGGMSAPLKHHWRRNVKSIRRIEQSPRARPLKKPYQEQKRVQKGAPKRRRSVASSETHARFIAPQLSILDVIEPNAPRFLRIAARTAREQSNQGRSSPRRKAIRLATREDHLDAVSTLHAWKRGGLRQRASVTAATKARWGSLQREPLAESCVNRGHPSSSRRDTSAANKKRKLVKHVSKGGSVSYRPKGWSAEPSKDYQGVGITTTTRANLSRPAVMEIDEPEQITKFAFHSRKRFLDRLYLNARSSSTQSPSQARAQDPDPAASYLGTTSEPREKRVGQQQKPVRYRKRVAPKRIDLAAPQYSHANDPIPDSYAVAAETVPVVASKQKDANYLGLGPYGTNYTHNFDVFPLHKDVFFHDSTIMGSGLLESCASYTFPKDGAAPRPRRTFQLGDHILHWGTWNDQVSSEFGVLFDYIVDQLDAARTNDEPETAAEQAAVNACDFLLSYVKQSINFIDVTHYSTFVARIMECMQSLNDRIQERCGSDTRWRSQIVLKLAKLYDRLLLTVLLVLTMCRHDSGLFAEQCQLESLLISVAQTTMLNLKGDIADLRRVYSQLNSARDREQGIRNDSVAIHSWVLVMNILDAAAIPRNSFWEVALLALCPDNVAASLDANSHETAWESMFLLLPLLEFNRLGVVLPGKREDAHSHAWVIPHRLLKSVFQLYQRSTRQAPSFNSYCRAIIARCHYLVQEWGWTQCVSIVGVIFDFFGAQNLGHLRNEEAFTSPSFLEHFDDRLAFRVEPEDRCFHVFLKLVAVAIRKLRDVGSFQAIKNLVFRTMPNHGRQYSKEDNVLARDIAALRNHHDLLCTLFCAAPPDLRPSASLLQNLVPATSHKEACLVNIRAWSQLSRFAVTTGEAAQLFKPLNAWRNSFFNQVLQQFESVAADVALQLSAMGKDVCASISKDTVDAAISINKNAVMSVLYASVAASLDVVQHAPDLDSTTFAMNMPQLQKILPKFAVQPWDLDWSIFKACIESVDALLSSVDDFKANEESQQSESQILNSEQADDALANLNDTLSQVFYAAARCLIASGESGTSVVRDKNQRDCVEQTVVLAARMTMRFTSAGLMRINDVFTKGKYRLFDDNAAQLRLRQREYLVLFVSTLLQHGFDDFSETPFSLSELWMMCLATPLGYLRFESRLAEQLGRLGMAFLPNGFTNLCTLPGYGNNCGLFEFAVSSMRKAVRDSGPELQKILVSDFSSTLKAIMDQIKADLKTLLATPAEHELYVLFVQQIVSLVKAYGSDICAVDNYFYQTSREYSPSTEDPQLQIASLMSYGLRLEDGDTKHTYQLFFLLFNNAKFSLANRRVRDEVKMLRGGMRNRGVARFILGKMLPAIFQAVFRESDGFPLLDIYAEALRRCFTKDAVPYELQVDELPAVLTLLKAVAVGITGLKHKSDLSSLHLHLLTRAISIGNLLWPSLRALRAASSKLQTLTDVVNILHKFHAVVSAINPQNAASIAASVPQDIGFDDVPDERVPQTDHDIETFAENIVQDVRKHWSTTNGRVSVQIPGHFRQSTNQHSAESISPFEEETHSSNLKAQIMEWNWWWERMETAGFPLPLEHVIF